MRFEKTLVAQLNMFDYFLRPYPVHIEKKVHVPVKVPVPTPVEVIKNVRHN